HRPANTRRTNYRICSSKESQRDRVVFVAYSQVQCELSGSFEIVLEEVGVIPLFGNERGIVYRLTEQARVVIQNILERTETHCTFGIKLRSVRQAIPTKVQAELQGIAARCVGRNILVLPGVIKPSLRERIQTADCEKVRDSNGGRYRIILGKV